MAVDRKPTALSLKLWLFVGMTPYVVQRLDLPRSLSDGPDVFGYAAIGAIWLGALISLVGLVWRGDELNGLVIEQVGLAFISAGLALYVVALFTLAPLTDQRLSDVGLAAGLCIAVGSGAVWQYATIRRYRAARLGPAGDGSADAHADRPDDSGTHDHGQ